MGNLIDEVLQDFIDNDYNNDLNSSLKSTFVSIKKNQTWYENHVEYV